MVTKTHRIAPCHPVPVAQTGFELGDDVLARAIRDARQTRDKALQQEALTWLWVCCPDVADELGLALPLTSSATSPTPSHTTPEALGYLQRYSAFSLA
ncbi:MAG: hypothetical protein U0350_20905 [Caldilineaceae bacterium]